MSDALERECRTFTRYLVSRDPTPYVVQQYRAAHAAVRAYEATGFDARLAALGRAHPALAFFADAHARVFAPRGAFRKKLVLLLAILETCPPFFGELERVVAGPLPLQILGVSARMLLFVVAVAAGTVVFLPLRLLSR